MASSCRHRWGNWIVRLVIASLVVQLVTTTSLGTAMAMAMAHQSVAGPLSRIIIICSSEGVRRITLDQDGNPTEVPEHAPADMQCPVCMALSQLQAAAVLTATELPAPSGFARSQIAKAAQPIDDRRPHVRCGLDPPTSS